MIIAVQWDKYVNHKEGTEDTGKKEVETLVDENNDNNEMEDDINNDDKDLEKEKEKESNLLINMAEWFYKNFIHIEWLNKGEIEYELGISFDDENTSDSKFDNWVMV
jgi:hypothetical protein